ncbi:hypothetical protein QVD17_29291 [Tagetes erecta]|uniref:Uncharacterized protein n=1 Tax=Tagetes erecta TaxID=13708 RepID=A0AAD8KBZ8_TARER|nr:hypothetical protein QVD17_29291 [Tagetes erecta]
MADVMARGHGGDGAQDPPPPNGDGRGHHEMDLVPKKTRGYAKIYKLERLLAKNGPLNLVFDRSATYTPVGEVMDLFGREASIYMWRSIPLDKHSWSNVSSAMRNALREHMNVKDLFHIERFDLDAIERDPDCSKLESGIRGIFMKKYRTRKNEAKQRFTQLGGKEKADEVKENPPVEDLKKEYECQNEALGEEGSSSQLHPRDVQIFEKVMGSRRGHVRGIGPKPSSASPSAFTREKEQETPPALTQAQVESLFQNQFFRDQFTQFLASYKAPNDGDEDDTNHYYRNGYLLRSNP